MISVIHVASNKTGVTDAQFAAGFDWAADRVYATRGVRVGFTLDVLPAGSFVAGSFKASADVTGPLLAQSASVLAVQCFIPEIHSGITTGEADLWLWKAGFSGGWIDSGIPFILDVSPGYDAHVVFPGSPVWGNNRLWRDYQTVLALLADADGITFNSWNGYTEGMAAMETAQYGAAAYN